MGLLVDFSITVKVKGFAGGVDAAPSKWSDFLISGQPKIVLRQPAKFSVSRKWGYFLIPLAKNTNRGMPIAKFNWRTLIWKSSFEISKSLKHLL